MEASGRIAVVAILDIWCWLFCQPRMDRIGWANL